MTKISVITINLNNAQGLLRTVESVVNQDYKNFEFIVVDGASSDDSLNRIEAYKSRITKIISEKDAGIYEAMNKGIKASTCEYLLFLNSGDYLVNEKVLSQVCSLLNGEDVIGGKVIKLVEGKEHVLDSPDKITVEWFLDVSLHHQATFVKKSLFDRFGLYNEEFKLGGDYEFFIRTLLKNNSTYKSIPVSICYFPTDGISNQQKWIDINMKEKQKTWDLHFSNSVQKHIQNYVELVNSKEVKLGQRIVNNLPFLKK